MNDKWIKPFQEKLGDYELELPATSPRRRGWIAPVLTGAAAAAAALLLLLPTTGRPARENPARLLAELPASVEIPTLSAPAQFLAPVRKQHVQPEEPGTPAIVTVTQPEEPSVPAQEQNATQEAGSNAVQQPAHEAAQTSTLPPQTFEQPREKTSGLSIRLHASPLAVSARQFLSSGGIFDQADYPKRSAIAMNNSEVEYEHYGNVVQISEPISVDCALPVRTGLSLILPISRRFALESGVDYAFHQATVSYGIVGMVTTRENYRMHYLGLPVKAYFSLADWEKAQLYASSGGEVEWLVAGRVQSKTAGGTTVGNHRIQAHPLLFSLTAGAGVEYKITSRLGLYAEPGIAWHFKPHGTLPNYYREHPLAFDLHLGLRFKIEP